MRRNVGKKAERQARRVEAALWREFCDSWVGIGQAAGREWRMLIERRTSERPRARFNRQNAVALMAMATMLGSAGLGSLPRRR